MSTAIDPSEDGVSFGFPELTSLGKQIEVLRIGRGLSKQHLARYAGTSRQQLWRVMTGKSELTAALRLRLAEALRVPPSVLIGEPVIEATSSTTLPSFELRPTAPPAVDAVGYLTRTDCIERTLRTLPNGTEGRELKRAFLNELEVLALKLAVALPPEFFDLRRRVLAGEL
jgi:transcriptional regulator with XRE-family HTH domain